MSKSKKNTQGKHKRKAQNQTNVDLLENPDALADRLLTTEQTLKKYRYVIGGVAAVIIIAVGIYFYSQYLIQSQETEAQEKMFPAVYLLQADSLTRVVEGDDTYPGMKEIYNDYSWSYASNLAHFYAGIAYIKDAKYEEAIEELEAFKSSDLLVQARAYALTGDAYMELENYKSAAEFYEKASNYKPNDYFTPSYLMKAALAYEKLEDYSTAIETYEQLIQTYPRATEINDAKKYKARLEAMSKS